MSAFDPISALDSTPLVGTAMMVVLVIFGLLLWLTGRRLARTACAVCGLVVSGGLAASLATSLGWHGLMLLVIPLAALVGCLIAALLFRLWMGLSMALLLALVVPAGMLILHGSPPPPVPPQITALSNPQHPPHLVRLTQPGTCAQLKGILQRELVAVHDWWAARTPRSRGTILTLATLGAGIGLIGGLLFPYASAAFQSALVGGAICLLGLRGLLMVYAPEQKIFLPAGPRPWLALLGLITLLGLLIQWAVWRPKADKS